MKAISIDHFGGIEQLHLTDLPKQEPKAGEVQIQISHAGVNPVDWKIREGWLKNWLPHEFPLIPGWDAAGLITAVGPEVEDYKVGDEVFAYCRLPTVQWGTYCESICVPSSIVARKPRSLTMAQAASIPLVSLTAWQSIFDFADLKENQSILIHAGAGGVGGIAIELAKWKGAKIATTASKKNHNYVKSLGADVLIDYTQESFVEKIKSLHPEGLDVVYDCVGGDTLKDSLQLVKRGGALPSIVDPIDEEFGKQQGVKTGFVFVSPNGSQLAKIAELIDTGKLKPPKITEYPLEKAAEAHEQSRSGHTCGKLVLKIS